MTVVKKGMSYYASQSDVDAFDEPSKDEFEDDRYFGEGPKDDNFKVHILHN